MVVGAGLANVPASQEIRALRMLTHSSELLTASNTEAASGIYRSATRPDVHSGSSSVIALRSKLG